MSEAIAETWEQELLTTGVVRGQLQEARRTLRALLEQKFGPLQALLVAQIEQTHDLERLRAAFQQALEISSLSELKL